MIYMTYNAPYIYYAQLYTVTHTSTHSYAHTQVLKLSSGLVSSLNHVAEPSLHTRLADNSFFIATRASRSAWGRLFDLSSTDGHLGFL